MVVARHKCKIGGGVCSCTTQTSSEIWCEGLGTRSWVVMYFLLRVMLACGPLLLSMSGGWQCG